MKFSRLLLWLAPLLLIAIVALFIGISSWVNTFLRSEDFRRIVSERTSHVLRAETTYAPLNWSGSSVFTEEITATGLAGSPIKTLKAEQVRTSVNWRAILDGAWHVEQVDIVSLDAALRQPSPEEPKEIPAKPAPPTGQWKGLPTKFQLDGFKIARARLSYAGASGADLLTLQDTALQLRPEGQGWKGEGQGGSLVMPGYPTFQVDTFRSRFQQGSFYLTDARLKYGETGRITLSGEFTENSRLQTDWQQVDVKPFLPADWKDKLSGFLSGSATTTWKAAKPKPATVGHFDLKDGLVQNVKVLDQIADFTGAPQFRRMPLQQLSGDFTSVDGRTTFTNLVAESKGLLRVEGTGFIDAKGRIGGAFRVGVTPQTLQWLPGSRELVFTVSENGYLWADMRLSGTKDNPKEDLSGRLTAAMKTEVIEQGAKVIETLPAPAREGAKKVMDILSPFLR